MGAIRTTLEILTPRDRQALHAAAVTVLGETGMRIDSPAMLQALQRCGCKVDHECRMVSYPESLLEKTIEQVAAEHAPRIVPTEKHNARRSHFALAGGALGYLDWPSGRIEQPCAKDAAFLLQFCEALGDDIEFTCMPLVYSIDLDGSEFDPRLWAIRSAGLLVKNSSKAYYHDVNSILELNYLMEMGIVIKGSTEAYMKDPILVTCQCCREPLAFDRPWAGIMAEMARRALRCDVGVMPISGATAPITPASAVVISLAEILAVMTAVKAVNPEAPVRYVSLSGQLNMANGISMMCSPVAALQDAALVEVCTHLYHWEPNCHSLYVDGILPAGQSAIEKALSYFRNAAIGAKNLRFPGFIGQSKVISPEQMLIDMDSGRWVDRFFHGLEVNAETLAVDEIRKAGVGGHFMATDHTLKHYKRYLWQPYTFRNAIEMPSRIDQISHQRLMDRAHEKVVQIMRKHQPYRLDKDKDRQIDRIVETGEKELLKALKTGTLE